MRARAALSSAYMLPNRRPTHLLNTPALIAHYVFWFTAKDAEKRETRAIYEAALENSDYFLDPPENDAWEPRRVIAANLNAWIGQFLLPEKENCQVPLFTDNAKKYFRSANFERNNDINSENASETIYSDISIETADPSVSVDRTLAFEGKIFDVRFEVILDIYSEHYTISIRIFPCGVDETRPLPDHISWNDQRRIRARLGRIRRAGEVLADLCKDGPGELEQKRDGVANPGESRFHRTDIEGRKALKAVYDQSWAAFFKLLEENYPGNRQFNPGGKPEVVDKSTRDVIKERRPNALLPGRLAGVFKNLIIRPMDLDDQLAGEDEHEHRESGQDIDIRSDRSLLLRNIPPGVIRHPKERSEIALEGFDAAGNDFDARGHIRARLAEHLNHRSVFFGLLLGFREKSRWIEDLRSGNSSLSLMLDGLAVHGSTLGMHTVERETYPHNEVRHFLIYGGASRQQLGRLVRGIHAVGEYRLLVLRDFESVDNAGAKLDGINVQLTNAERLVTQETPDAILGAKRVMRSAVETLFQIKALGEDGGLEYRLSRIVAYESHLLRHLDILRIGRLEGWRPIDEFISRSVLPYVTHLMSVRSALESADQAVQRLDYSLLTHRTTSFVGKIHRLQSKASRQNRLVMALGALAAASGFIAAGTPVALAGFLAQADTAISNFIMFGIGIVCSGIGLILLVIALLRLFAKGDESEPAEIDERY